MELGYFILFFLVVTTVLALRIKNKVSRIFLVAAICSFFLVMTVVAVLPDSAITAGYSLFVTSLSLVGFIFVVIVLINILFNNLMGRPKKVKKPEENAK